MYEYYSDFTKHAVPQWLKDGKFGIYTHWGIYSVPAAGPNGTWYPRNMYREGTEQYLYHKAHYGDPSRFGYKDFIPMFTGEKFDAEQWAELFKKAGAKFAGPVGEHHDGFSMWNTRYSDYNSVNMGPKRDVVAELEKAYRNADMKFMVAMHHAENWFFFPRQDTYDTIKEFGLYGRNHKNVYDQNTPGFWKQEKPDQRFLDSWLGKVKEIVDRFSPDLLWFDFGLGLVQEQYKEEMLAYYYNHAQNQNQDVIVTYKNHDLPVGSGLIDIEVGRYGELSLHNWITDTTVDKGEGWSYIRDTEYKSPRYLIHYLIDNVSKNGFLLLNVGPKPNGEIPDQAKEILLEMGKWLEVNGEAIYGTVPWVVSGEGETNFSQAGQFGGMGEKEDLIYNQKDIRYTQKDNCLYAIVMTEPKGKVLLTVPGKIFYPNEVKSVELLGSGLCPFELTPDGLSIIVPEQYRTEYAAAFKIKRQNPFK